MSSQDMRISLHGCLIQYGVDTMISDAVPCVSLVCPRDSVLLLSTIIESGRAVSGRGKGMQYQDAIRECQDKG